MTLGVQKNGGPMVVLDNDGKVRSPHYGWTGKNIGRAFWDFLVKGDWYGYHRRDSKSGVTVWTDRQRNWLRIRYPKP